MYILNCDKVKTTALFASQTSDRAINQHQRDKTPEKCHKKSPL